MKQVKSMKLMSLFLDCPSQFPKLVHCGLQCLSCSPRHSSEPKCRKSQPQSLFYIFLHMPSNHTPKSCPIRQWAPTLLASVTSFMEDNIFMNQDGRGEWFQDDSRTLHVLCTLCLLLLHCDI